VKSSTTWFQVQLPCMNGRFQPELEAERMGFTRAPVRYGSLDSTGS
jgi:hypothetical protein